MALFQFSAPLLRCKQAALDVQDLRGLLNIKIRLWKITLFSAAYTRVDQAILLWAIATIIIFGIAQFWPMSWKIQATLWSSVTALATVGMYCLTEFWAKVERLTWVIWMWALLILAGLIATNLGIFLGIGWVLVHLCPIWLGISALGYFLTALGLQSRTFVVAGTLHLIGIEMLQLIPGWSFLMTGLMMGGTLWLLSELQWDMRPPVEPALLTLEERQFNQQQYLIRMRSELISENSSLE